MECYNRIGRKTVSGATEVEYFEIGAGMKIYWKVVLSGFLTICGIYGINTALQPLNYKSDVAVALGYALGSLVLFLWFAVLNLIWRKKEKHEEPKVS